MCLCLCLHARMHVWRVLLVGMYVYVLIKVWTDILYPALIIPHYDYIQIVVRYSHPRPNFGCLLMKSHTYNVKAFRRDWANSQKNDNRSRTLVATDQNAIVGAIKWASWRCKCTVCLSKYHLSLNHCCAALICVSQSVSA
jgi:hypothetical protein